jgi:hypothetical protein
MRFYSAKDVSNIRSLHGATVYFIIPRRLQRPSKVRLITRLERQDKKLYISM